MLLSYPKGQVAQILPSFLSQRFSTGSPFHVVIASGHHHQQSTWGCAFWAEKSSMFLKMKQLPNLPGCNLDLLLSFKASICLGGCFCSVYLSSEDWTISSCVSYIWSRGQLTILAFLLSAWAMQGVWIGGTGTTATLPQFTPFFHLFLIWITFVHWVPLYW